MTNTSRWLRLSFSSVFAILGLVLVILAGGMSLFAKIMALVFWEGGVLMVYASYHNRNDVARYCFYAVIASVCIYLIVEPPL